MTQEYSQADECIDKSIKNFKLCGRKDQENIMRIQKANSLINLKEWNAADNYFSDLLKDASFSERQIGDIYGYYAMMLLYSPTHDDSKALEYLSRAIETNGKLKNIDQYGAYAYLLDRKGRTDESNAIFDQIKLSGPIGNYSYDYWTHRVQKYHKDFQEAYYSLWVAKHIADSISHVNLSKSASNAQIAFMERQRAEEKLKFQGDKQKLTILILFALLIILSISLLQLKRRNYYHQERERMAFIIDSLNAQLNEMEIEKSSLGDKINKLSKQNTKAKFAYLASLYEIIRPYSKNGIEVSDETLFQIINNKVKTLREDKNANIEFEKALNEESENIMERFRLDFPDLNDKEYQMISYIFAGFDNTSIMLIMDITSTENTRAKKSRLKAKIESSSVDNKKEYLERFNTIVR